MGMSARVQRLKEKLEQLKQQDPNLSVHGAKHHKYRFNPCLTIEQLTTRERNSLISFPEEYRTFLLEMGNGGAGPAYGVFSLEESLQEITPEFQNDREFLAHPFLVPSSIHALPPVLQKHYEQYDSAPGVLPICHEGSGIMDSLIVSGPERGNIWQHREEWSSCPRHVKPSHLSWEEWDKLLRSGQNPYRATFFDWYEGWLDLRLESLHKKQTQSY